MNPSIQAFKGNCLEFMGFLADDTIDTILTDPPYGIDFMGKKWDSGIRFQEYMETVFREALRVCKPGATAMVFGGTRMFFRMACAMQDAGWEIRDCLLWLYGTGFPKGQNIAKAIDKAAGAERTQVVGTKLGRPGMAKDGSNQHATFFKCDGNVGGVLDANIYAPATDLAAMWEGWNTTLKPAWEPIIYAARPLAGTYAENAARYGVAGINIDGCRLGWGDEAPWKGGPTDGMAKTKFFFDGERTKYEGASNPGGRWPANVIFDEEAAFLLDAQMAGASRFFYCPKPSRAERGKANSHPTVKPVALMRWLARLTKTPTGGLVLDPFAGSGTTALACHAEGRDCWLVEREGPYFAILKERIGIFT